MQLKASVFSRELRNLGLYTFYHTSPQNRAKTRFNELALTPLMPTRIGGTRWLVHLLRAFLEDTLL